MAVQEQSECRGSNTSVTGGGNCMINGGAQSERTLQLGDICSYGAENTAKVRKTYTITKQREKWTAEEHQKFLEALKLYGRGWRQIEEHVGTKTAVQIRSHAQKFFSKVVRETNGSTESSIDPAEIPPPRPKRKPLHPYPRKLVDSFRGTSVSNQPERSPSPNLSAAEKDSQSPTSVLSAFVSDELGSAVSEHHNTCPSPTSCTTSMISTNLSTVQNENKFITSNLSDEIEKGSATVNFSANSAVDNLLSLKCESDGRDIVCRKDDTPMNSPVTSIKLFGTTVLVTETNSSSSPVGDRNQSPSSKIGQQDLDLTVHLSLQMSDNDWYSIPCGAPISAAESQNRMNQGFQLWSLYRGRPYVYITPSDNTSSQTCISPDDSLKETSCTGSNAGSLSGVENSKKNLERSNSECQESCPEGRVGSFNKSSKGFVPYKRCLEQRDTSSSLLVSEENDRKKARVSS